MALRRRPVNWAGPRPVDRPDIGKIVREGHCHASSGSATGTARDLVVQLSNRPWSKLFFFSR